MAGAHAGPAVPAACEEAAFQDLWIGPQSRRDPDNGHGAMLFVLSNFLDHTDGELARISGKSSRFGHAYDLACDAVIHVFVFIAIGYGLRHGPLGAWAVPMGALALLRCRCTMRETLVHGINSITWANRVLPVFVGLPRCCQLRETTPVLANHMQIDITPK